MAKLSIVAGATSQSINIFIRDSSSTTGAGLSGLVYNSAGLTAYYSFAGANATSTAITLATLAAVNSAYSSGGFKELDATNMKGWYRFDIPNAAIAGSKGRSVALHFQGATNMAPCPVEIELTGVDNQDSVRQGMTALPNTACTGNASLITSGSGTDQLTVTSGLASADAKKINAVSTSSVTTVNANIGVTQPINFTGTGASAYVKCDIIDIAGAAVATGTAQLGVNVVSYASGQAPLQPTVAGRTLDVSATGEAGVDWANVGSPTTTVGLTGTTISTGQTITSVSGAVGSVTGAVGSVTGAVGSVTGNVGGNVVGSVGSVSGAVGSVTGNVGGNVVGSVGSVSSGVTVTTNNDKSNYVLASTGLDSITTTAPSGVASTFPQMVNQLWRRFFKKATMTSTQLKTYADDGTTVITTQTLSDDGTTQTEGAAS